MAILRRDDWLTSPQGQALAGAEVFYLQQPANTAVFPPTPLASIYSDLLGTPATNPQITDGNGHAVAYMSNSQLYTVVFYHPLLGAPLVLKDQALTGGSGSAAFTPFQQIPTGVINGVNRVFTLSVVPTLLFLNYNTGTLQQGVGYTAAVVGGVYTVTLAIAPQVGDSLYASGIL